MKKCTKCGYERLPKIKYYAPSTECPDCGVIYEKNETYLAQKKLAQKKLWERISLKPKLPKNLNKKPYILALTAIFILGFLFVTAQYVIFPYLKKQELDKLDKLDKQNCNKAYVALKKVEALLESGINYRDYGNAVSSVRIELNLLKGDSKRAEELEKIYTYYQLSKELWSAKVKDDRTVIINIIEAVGKISYKFGAPIIINIDDMAEDMAEAAVKSSEILMMLSYRWRELYNEADESKKKGVIEAWKASDRKKESDLKKYYGWEKYYFGFKDKYVESFYEPAQQGLWHEASGLLKDYEQK